MPVTYDDAFDENAGASLPMSSVASLNLVSICSARNSTSGFVSRAGARQYSGDPDGFRRDVVIPVAGIAERRPKGAMQIIPGRGVNIENACDAERRALAAAEAAGRKRSRRRRRRRRPGAGASVPRPGAEGEDPRAGRGPVPLLRHGGPVGQGQAADSGTWSPIDPDAEPPASIVRPARRATPAREPDARRGRDDAARRARGQAGAEGFREGFCEPFAKGSGSVSRTAPKRSTVADLGSTRNPESPRNASGSVSRSVPRVLRVRARIKT